MAKDIPYFKFYPSEWIMGRISGESDKVQGAFLIACCFYWNAKCEYFCNDFERKIGKKRFKMLSELKYFEIKQNRIVIPFLDEQFSEMTKIQQVRVKGGLARAEHMLSMSTSTMAGNKNKNKNKIKMKEQMLSSQKWIESFCMRHGLKDINSVESWVDKFNNHLDSVNKNHENYDEYVSHFNNWMTKQPKQKNNQLQGTI